MQTVVGVNSWVAHHNTAVFGPDASEFVPERWLGDPQRAAAMDRYFLAVSPRLFSPMFAIKLTTESVRPRIPDVHRKKHQPDGDIKVDS